MSESPIVDASGRPYPGMAHRQLAARAAQMQTAYRAADPMSQELATWHPAPVSADTAMAHERIPIAGRLHDLVRNNGWASQAVRRECESVIGANLRLSYMPDYEALGLSLEWATEFKREVQGRWRLYANDPDFAADAARQNSVPVLLAQAYRHFVMDGEGIGAILQREGRTASRTILQIMHPLRLSNPAGVPESDDLRSGVEVDEYGAAHAYHFRDRHPYDAAAFSTARQFSWTRIPRETPWGRPNILHVFESEQAGQTRGISRLAALVEGLKTQDKYERTEMQAAIVNAILAAYIESPMDTQLLMEGMNAKGLDQTGDGGLSGYQGLRDAFHDSARLTLGGVQLQHLFPGEKLGFHAAARPAANYEPFVSSVLRKSAAATGMSYEQVAGDWSKVNYSSARASLLEVWRGLYARRHVFTQGFCTPFFGAWLEEEIAEGRLDHVLPKKAPSFWEAKAAYVRANWIGPARGWVDPDKESKASGNRMRIGISTFADEAAEQGKDPDEHRMALAAERQQFANDGLTHPMDMAEPVSGAAATSTDDSRPGDATSGEPDSEDTNQ